MFGRSQLARQGVLLWGLVGATGWARSSLANDHDFVRLTWARSEGAEDCPSEVEVMRRLRERLRRDPFVADARRRLEGEVTRNGSHWRILVRERDPLGKVLGSREIDAEALDCGPIAAMAMLALALAIDPDAGSPEGDTSLTSSPPPIRSGVEAAVRLTAPVPGPIVANAPHAGSPACSLPEAPGRTEFSLRALASGGVLSRLAPGVGVAAQSSLTTHWQAELGMQWFWEQPASNEAKFGLTFVHVGLCGEILGAERVRWDACSHLQVGALHSVVSGLETVNPGDTLWWAWAGGTRILLPTPLLLEAGAYAVVPLIRPDFVVGGRSGPLFSPSTVGGIFFLGAGMSIR